MKHKFFILGLIICASCSSNEDKEDMVNTVPTNGSIETSVKVDHISDTTDILTTKHTVYTTAQQVKTIIKVDTIPALGTQVLEDENDKPQQVKKDYNIYITVK